MDVLEAELVDEGEDAGGDGGLADSGEGGEGAGGGLVLEDDAVELGDVELVGGAAAGDGEGESGAGEDGGGGGEDGGFDGALDGGGGEVGDLAAREGEGEVGEGGRVRVRVRVLVVRVVELLEGVEDGGVGFQELLEGEGLIATAAAAGIGRSRFGAGRWVPVGFF